MGKKIKLYGTVWILDRPREKTDLKSASLIRIRIREAKMMRIPPDPDPVKRVHIHIWKIIDSGIHHTLNAIYDKFITCIAIINYFNKICIPFLSFNLYIKQNIVLFNNFYWVREAAKKKFFYGSAIKALTPSPLELNGSRNFAVGKKIVLKFSLMARPLPLRPSLMRLPLKKRIFFLLSIGEVYFSVFMDIAHSH